MDPPPDVFIPTSGHWISTVYNSLESLKQKEAELKTLEWRISLSMLDLRFFLISRLNYACSPLVINLQVRGPGTSATQPNYFFCSFEFFFFI